MGWRCLLTLAAGLLAAAGALGEGMSVAEWDEVVVCIEGGDGNGQDALGSGFFVDPHHIVTVAHDLVGSESLTVYRQDGARARASVVAVDENADVMLLNVRESCASGAYAPMVNLPQVQLGESVSTIGCPFGLEHSLSRGFVSHPGRAVQGSPLVQMDMRVHPGNSGGPVFNAQGQMIGMIRGTLKASPNISFAIPAGVIARLLDNARVGTALAQLWNKAQGLPPSSRGLLYRRMAEQVPEHRDDFLYLGQALLELGDAAPAREALEHFLSGCPGHYDGLVHLGRTEAALGNWTAARDLLLEAAALAPERSAAYWELAHIYAAGLGDEAAAAATFRHFLALAPNDSRAAEAREWLRQHADDGDGQ